MANKNNLEITNAEVLMEEENKTTETVTEIPTVTDDEVIAEEAFAVEEESEKKSKRLSLKEVVVLVGVSILLLLLLIWLMLWLTGVTHRIGLDSRNDGKISYTETTTNSTPDTNPGDENDSTTTPDSSDSNAGGDAGTHRTPETTQNTNPSAGNTNNGNGIGGNTNNGNNGNHGNASGNDNRPTTNPSHNTDNGNNSGNGGNGNQSGKPTDTDNGNGQGSGNGENTDNKNDNDSTPDYAGDTKVKIASFNDDTGIITVTVDGESLMVPVQTTYFNGRVTKSGVAQGKIFGYNIGVTVMLFYPQSDGFSITEANGYMSRTADGLTVLVDLNGDATKLLIKINGMKSLF